MDSEVELGADGSKEKKVELGGGREEKATCFIVAMVKRGAGY